jgi:peptide/nickel transport system substrate-binding protein
VEEEMIKKRAFQLLLVFVICVICGGILINCAGTPSTQSTPAQTAKPAGPQTGGVLTISMPQDAERLGNPPSMVNQNDPLYAHPAIENLIRFDNSGAPIPWLATGWTTDTKAMIITLNLRKDVNFHDGTPFNADACIWNLDRYQKTSGRAELAAVKSYEKVDDYTVKLNLSRLDSLLIANLGLAPGLMVSPTAYNKAGTTDAEKKEWAEKNPVGTGPFKFVSWQRDVKITYTKFDGYWQKGKPYLNGIEFIPIKDPMTQLASFQRGEVALLPQLDAKSAKDLEMMGKYKVLKSNVPQSIYSLTPDSAHSDSVFSNIKVRQAVWHAIDMNAISNSLGYGYWQPLNQFAPKGSFAYNPDIKGYPYDPVKAKQLLAEAGYPNGFKTTILGQSIVPFPDMLAAIQNMMAKVGIDAKIDVLEQARFAKIITGGKAEGGWKDGMLITPWTTTPNEFAPWNRLLAREVHAERYPSLDEPEELQDYIAEAVSAPTFDAMKASIMKLTKADTDKYCFNIWLYAMVNINARNVNVNNDGIQIRTHWTPEDAWLSK